MRGLTIAVLQWACVSASGGTTKEPYEWAGIFETPNPTYMWTAQKVSNKYADRTMKLVVLPAVAANEAQLSASVKSGKLALNQTCTTVQHGGVLTPKDGVCYKLQFDQDLWQSYYVVDTSQFATVSFFTEHVPTEFEDTAHYLKDHNGDDIEPLAELPVKAAAAHSDEHKAKWGPSMGAAVAVNFITLVGVILAVPGLRKLHESYNAAFEACTGSFSAGALLACAFYLLLFEATHLVATGWTKESEVTWRWGTMVLAGFLLPALLECPVNFLLEGKSEAKQENEGLGMWSVRPIAAVTFGDFMHNLCDGFFIGAAFKGCGEKTGWTVATGTIVHEIAQELADYTILTSKNVGLSPVKALAINFLAGLSVVLGVIIVNDADMKNKDIGLLLAFGGGVYVYLAGVECMPKVHSKEISPKVRLLCLALFILGAIVIGLVLLDHEHCVPSSSSGGSSGGGHAH